jgi:hypothetical protein
MLWVWVMGVTLVNEELLKFELCCKNKNKNKKSSHWNKT